MAPTDYGRLPSEPSDKLSAQDPGTWSLNQGKISSIKHSTRFNIKSEKYSDHEKLIKYFTKKKKKKQEHKKKRKKGFV